MMVFCGRQTSISRPKESMSLETVWPANHGFQAGDELNASIAVRSVRGVAPEPSVFASHTFTALKGPRETPSTGVCEEKAIIFPSRDQTGGNITIPSEVSI